MAIVLDPCRSDDHAALIALLGSRGLPEAGLSAFLDTAVVAREDGRLVGSAAIEPREGAGLLRSVAVAPDHEAHGLGSTLIDAALEMARARGLESLYLLTETAGPFFARRGFRAVTRSRVPADVKRSVEFTGACCASALAMTRAVSPSAGLDGSRDEVLVRPATGRDIDAITGIYNQGIEDRLGTFETRLRQPSDVRAWFDGPHPIVVTVRDGGVAAFASTSGYRARSCYAGIAEYSVYVERNQRGHGLGRAAMSGLLQAATDAGFWKLVSRIFVENVASRRLMQSLGFREVGTYERHARLDGVWRDVVIVERLLEANMT